MVTIQKIENILNNDDPNALEALAQEAKSIKEQYFGRTISLYAPIYLSNFCSSHCTYCGFHSHNKINRFKLSDKQIHQEMKYVSEQGFENILLLTGESYKVTPLSYLKNAVNIAKQYFSSISLEVHPMSTEEYQQLHEQGVDGITLYQETYDRKRYAEVHLSGIKADYEFRLQGPQRATQGGVRNISLGILLGLSDQLAPDLFALYNHLNFLERNYPGVEYSLSFPRFQPIKNKKFSDFLVDDKTFIKIICMTRIFFPRVGINLSTRENATLRDHTLELGITKISAGSNTSVGGYTQIPKNDQDPQFDIEDKRNLDEIVRHLKQKDFDPVFTDWRRIENQV